MDAVRRWKRLRIAITFVALFVAWLVFTVNPAPASLAAGLAVSFLIAWGSYSVFIEDYEAGRRSLFPRLLPALAYFFLLIASLYASSARVLVAVITGRCSPRVVHFRTRLRADLARAVLAESITFTPGTIVLELDEDHLVVHWLFATTRHSARAGEEIKGRFERLLRRVWA